MSGEVVAEKAAEKVEERAVAVPKHPLQTRWRLWFYKASQTGDWGANMKEVYTFDTVEDFWALYNHIVPPSGLGNGCDYNLFRDGIKPMWEDERNKDGGRWAFIVNKQQGGGGPGAAPGTLDFFWLETLMLLIGEGFNDDEACESVNGAVVSLRMKGDRLSVWMSTTRREQCESVGRTLKERLGASFKIGFEPHKSQSLGKSSAYPQALYTL